MITVARPSGIAVPFKPPDLTVDASIRRGWEMDDDDLLMVPKREEFLPTYPLPYGFAVHHQWGAGIPYGGPMITGLPAL
jgi:hypothetical protein